MKLGLGGAQSFTIWKQISASRARKPAGSWSYWHQDPESYPEFLQAMIIENFAF